MESGRRISPATVIAFATLTTIGAQQPPNFTSDQPRFEVVSIKRNMSGRAGSSFETVRGRFRATNVSVLNLVAVVANLRDYEILEAPSWARSERFDLSAVWPGQANEPFSHVRSMLRTMLADRFDFDAHTETRDVPVYELLLARDDGRLGEHLRASGTLNRGVNGNASRSTGVRPDGLRMAGTDIASLARQLASIVDRPVVDRTGLSGRFDVELSWNADPLAVSSGLAAPEIPGPVIFTAVQEQLGLRLRASRGPHEVLVIDAIRPPSPD